MYVDYLINWLTDKTDLELEPELELQVIRVIIDSYESFTREYTFTND